MAVEYVKGNDTYIGHNRLTPYYRRKVIDRKGEDRRKENIALIEEGHDYLDFLVERIKQGNTIDDAIEQAEIAYGIVIETKEIPSKYPNTKFWDIWFIF